MKTDILVVGAGFAGASTAYHLSQNGAGSILIVDKEGAPGVHASGRNASLVLQSTASRPIRQTAAASRAAYQERAAALGFRPVGSLLIGSRQSLSAVRQPDLIPSEYRDPEQIRREIPLLKGHPFEAALWTPSDGIMDISRLLRFYLDGAREKGAELRLDSEVAGIRGKGPFQVETSRGPVEAGILINAAGAWASGIGAMAGAARLPLASLKRHLFVLDDVGEVSPEQPFVWSLAQNFYFRPESGGLLFSICDEEKSPALEPTVSPEITQSLAELLWQQLPALRQATQRDVWACFRTKTPDGQFVIGQDPGLNGFFWVAGLGGQGMGTSWEVGRLAARSVLSSDVHPQFAPGRFETTLATDS